MEFIMRYDWPGNIRELRNAIEQSVLLSTRPQVSHAVLEQSTSTSGQPAAKGPGPAPEAGGKPIHIEKAVIVNSRGGLDIADLNRLLASGDAPALSKADRNNMPAKRDICHGLKKFRGSVSRTAEYLGLKVPRLYYLMKIMGISARDFKPGRRRNPPV
jgi:DNA-binding NtrC family response regulator